MEKRTRHATKQAKASIKEAIGMLIGDPKVQAEGAAEKASGENNAGGSIDAKIAPKSNIIDPGSA